jgi:small redox-active disulfide protein 2
MDTNIRKIEVLGPGCARCKETFRVVQHVVESAGLTCSVVKEESIQRMIELGVMATPAIVIDGSVVLSGRIPKADEVKALLGVG